MTRILLIIVFISFHLLSLAQEYNAELILQRTDISITKGHLNKDVSYEIKINNRAGEKYAKIVIPYSKLIKVSNIKACIKDSNGRIVNKLEKNDVIEKSSISDFSFYEDDYVKEFTLKHNSYPYTIIYSYQVQQTEFLYIDYWTPIIDEKIPTLSANLKVTMPLQNRIAYKNQYVNNPSIDTIGNLISYQWNTSYVNLVNHELLSPPLSELIPNVAITPYEFNYIKAGTCKDWISYGNWHYELIQGITDLPDNEKSNVASLTADLTNDVEKIRTLYHYLQDNTRYINISIETGGLKPYPAVYVAQNKYGDCKALTNYFKALLDYVGIKSYYTMVFAGNPIKEINKEFPSQQFNHVILFVPCKEKDIWLDCTSNAAFNYLGTFTQNRDAFIVDFHNSRFVQTPALTPSDVLETRKIEINYKQQEANVKFKNIYKGDMYESILVLAKNFNASEKSKIVADKLVDEGFQLIDYQISTTERDSTQINLNYEVSTQNIYNHYGNDILLSNITFSIPHFEKPEIRTLPVQIDYPISMIDTLIYEIPFGYELNTNNLEHNISARFGIYRFNGFENEGKLVVIKSLLINSGYYSISDYGEFYNFYSQIIGIENKTNFSFKKIF